MAENQLAEHPQRIGSPHTRLTIGYLAHTIYGDSQMQWLGMVDAAQNRDVNLICFPGRSLGDSSDFRRQANILYDLVSAASVDGLVSWASSVSASVTDDEARAFHERYRPLPVVTIGQAWKDIPGVAMASYPGMYETVTHLIEVHHCRRLALIRGPENHLQAQVRYQAYIDALGAHGLSIDPNLVVPPAKGWDRSFGGQAVHVLLDERRLRPQVDLDAIVAVNDGLLFGALQVLQERGIRVPNDLAVTGFDNILLGQVHTPSFTTVAAPYYKLGYQALDTLLALLEGQPVAPETQVPAQVIIRQSCGCPDLLVAQATLESAEIRHETIESTLLSRRDEIIAAMVQALGEPDEAISGRVGRVLTSLVGELRRETPGLFIRDLDEALHQTMNSGGDVSAWHSAISALRYQTLPCARDQTFALASDLWQQARVIIATVTQRARAQAQLQVDQQTQMLRETGTTLLTTFDMQDLMNVLSEQLPRLGIPSCYLSLYEDPQPYQYPRSPAEWSRLVLAYDENGCIELEPGGRRFPSRQLVPEGMLSHGRRYSFVAEPLYFQDNQIGFVLFEVGPREANVYEVLRVQISSALQGASLIQRVENRAVQFQTVAQVSRATSSILDLEMLLQEVVNVIQKRFDLYYVGLFLAEESGEQAAALDRWAILRAGTGEAGQQMIAQGHRLKVDESSMVGWAISQRQARIALDVGYAGEIARFNNPLLPATRSEIALPLISRGGVIGALDAQSLHPEAFSDEDVEVLQTMADQVALAIGNAQLFQQVQDSLEAERRAYGELSQQAWQTLLQTRSDLNYVCDERGIMPATAATEPHMRVAAQTGEAAVATEDERAVALPIKVRDQVIGVINVHKPEQGAWTQEQIVLLETLTEQLGLALESARLYQDTQRAAVRERIIGQVSGRIRQEFDLEAVLKTTVDQIQQVLGLDKAAIRLVSDVDQNVTSR
jgi:DNA-binding LacI/PurR family transcriptional regulator/GAF domain-containing protein